MVLFYAFFDKSTTILSVLFYYSMHIQKRLILQNRSIMIISFKKKTPFLR